MMKLLLFLCFTTVHVLGENSKDVLLINNGPNKMLGQNISEPVFQAKSLSKKIGVVEEPVPASLDTNENKTKLEETLNSSTVPSSKATASHSEITVTDSATVPSSTAVPSSTTERVIEATTTAASNSPVTFTETNKATASAISPGKWIVNGTNKVCLVVQMSVAFNISYMDNNHTVSFKTFDMPVDNRTTTAKGSCGNLEQNLTLSWSSQNLTNNGSMAMHFVKNESKSYYSLHHLEVVLPASDFKNTSLNESMVLVHNASYATVGLHVSYRCVKQQTFHLTHNNTNETAGYLTISNLQFQAFKNDNSTAFGYAEDCFFDTADAVPIAVGCALAGLVMIVLIAYLVGRRRSQAHGYLSM
ncbi:lysosome-associated membrane glycoprotein 1 [Osmia bicornis bicornis]|uniref:lysosome-associated membrane glycoprotein 1 n=1 Tax=Osmia bicornis bicornis TaxID=1437191 RepID=UPI001EAEE3B8|nr:lysosome-associated membrane glycoprotein 1 [Osmia bicornis bicornis]